jgi:hypothetical protein
MIQDAELGPNHAAMAGWIREYDPTCRSSESHGLQGPEDLAVVEAGDIGYAGLNSSDDGRRADGQA